MSKGNDSNHRRGRKPFDLALDAQASSGRKPGSRRQHISINHLLDFQGYRDSREFHDRRARGGAARPRRRSGGTRPRATLHGMAYINCHYKFVVDYRGDYRPQQLDPNVPANVQDIIRIIAPRGNACPICLADEPVAPRMLTACGHVLCLACLLSLLDSEIPQRGAAVSAKYNDCPLCSAIIRKRDVKPVLISAADERFEVPRVGEEVALTLMTRPQSKLLSLPASMAALHDAIGTFPWAVGTGGAADAPDLAPYSRFLMADLAYLEQMYEHERAALLSQWQHEREFYGDDGKYFELAVAAIDEDVAMWRGRYASAAPSRAVSRASKEPTASAFEKAAPSKEAATAKEAPNSSAAAAKEAPTSSASAAVPTSSVGTAAPTSSADAAAPTSRTGAAPTSAPFKSATYFYYQTGFNASSTFVLSPLDMKVLKHSYHDDYANLPSSLVAEVENIRYEELNAELALTKYKYLSHMPFGTTIGFLECNWSRNQYLRRETWEAFRVDLTARSQNSSRKYKREEQNRKRAQHAEEARNREFYERENGTAASGGTASGGSGSSFDQAFGALSIADYLPELPAAAAGGSSGCDAEAENYQTTIWGTRIPQAEDAAQDDDDGEAEEMIRRAREAMRQEGHPQRSKKKKRIVLEGW
ncbi:hypothetical protein ABC855_g3187 [[Candida] zeylanoides]